MPFILDKCKIQSRIFKPHENRNGNLYQPTQMSGCYNLHILKPSFLSEGIWQHWWCKKEELVTMTLVFWPVIRIKNSVRNIEIRVLCWYIQISNRVYGE